MSYYSNPKVADLDGIPRPDEQVLWLDIAVNHLLIVCILQCSSDLVNVQDNPAERELRSSWMLCPQRSAGSISRDEIGSVLFKTEIEDAYNMWVIEARMGPCLS